MKINIILQNSWLHYTNEDAPKSANYKLHVALPIENFDAYHEELRHQLEIAVGEGIIRGFKILNRGDSHDLEKQLGGKDVPNVENKNARLYNNPITIYLTEKFNPNDIAALCAQLEICLSKVAPINVSYLSIADLPLTDHITFRQENLDGEYVSIARASEEELGRLQKEGNASEEYQRLRQVVFSNEKTVKKNEKEDNIRRFYNSHYEHYNSDLNSDNTHKQFQAACDLLNIDTKTLKDTKTEKDWLEKCKKPYRTAAHKYHPDKTASGDMIAICTNLTTLVNKANDTLKRIAEDRSLLDENLLLEQHPYRPRYQYELKTPQFDPYYFIRLAKSSSQVIIIQNWQFSTQPKIYTTTSEDGLTESSVTVYKPQLTMYDEKSRPEKLMPGHEAFYNLFMAGAIPGRFAQGHLSMIFDDQSIRQPGVQWLLKRALTMPELLLFMDSNDVMRLAKKATELNIEHIGYNSTDVFIYYYKYHPESLYRKRLQKWVKEKDFDIQKATQFILDNPQYLSATKSDNVIDELLTWNQTLRQSIFSSRLLMRRVSSYTIDDEFVKPIFGKRTDDLEDIQSITIAYLMRGDSQILEFISTPALASIKAYITSNVQQFPPFIIDDIQFELDLRSGIKDNTKAGDKSDVSMLDVLKNTFVKNQEIVNSLNKEALVSLISSDLHWSYTIVIINALYDLGESSIADPYLIKIGKELNLLKKDQDLGELRSFITKEAIDWKDPEKRKMRINSLVNSQDDQLVNPETMAKINSELEFLGASKEIYTLHIRLEKIYRKEYFPLLHRLRKGEDTLELKQAFLNLRSRVMASGCRWEEISKYDDITEGYSLVPRSELPAKKLAQPGVLYFEEKTSYYSGSSTNTHYLICGTDWEGKPKKFEGTFHEYVDTSDLESMLRYTSHHHQVPKNYAISGDIIYHLMKNTIGVFDNYGLEGNSDHISEGIYGVIQNTSIEEQLERLFYIYECLESSQKFYETFALITEPNVAFIGLEKFDPNLIKSHLLNYAKNEFAVYIKGSRDSARGQYHRCINVHNIKSFNELQSLFTRLDKQKTLESLIPNAYEQLSEAYQTLTKDYAKSRDKQPVFDPVIKYAKIRKFTKVRGELENKAVQLSINNILQKILDHSDYRITFEFDIRGKRKEHPWFSLSILTSSIEHNEKIDMQEIYSKIADILYNPSIKARLFSSHDPRDNARSKEFLSQIYDDSFLRDHFGLNDISKEELWKQSTQQRLAENLRYNMRSGPHLPALKLESSPSLTFDHKSTNSLTYSGNKESGTGFFNFFKSRDGGMPSSLDNEKQSILAEANRVIQRACEIGKKDSVSYIHNPGYLLRQAIIIKDTLSNANLSNDMIQDFLKSDTITKFKTENENFKKIGDHAEIVKKLFDDNPIQVMQKPKEYKKETPLNIID
ncbi:hypothetical protein L3V86_04350 [Thiotrichales bacterium 19S11-10]|nr:hypothetical protein [Thiotrichales bacterium 19S11-10]